MAKKKAANQEEAFLAAIRASPEDLLPRLVYADWLDERNDPRGEYIRLDAELFRSQQGGTSADASISARHTELEDTLDPRWFMAVRVSRVEGPPYIYPRFWRTLAGYDVSCRSMRQHLESIPEFEMVFLADQFKEAAEYVNPCCWKECRSHLRRGCSEDFGDDVGAWVVMQGKEFYAQVRSHPEQVNELLLQCDSATLELRRRLNSNRRRKPSPAHEDEEDRIEFRLSRVDWLANEIYMDRHGRDMPELYEMQSPDFDG